MKYVTRAAGSSYLGSNQPPVIKFPVHRKSQFLVHFNFSSKLYYVFGEERRMKGDVDNLCFGIWVSNQHEDIVIGLGRMQINSDGLRKCIPKER